MDTDLLTPIGYKVLRCEIQVLTQITTGVLGGNRSGCSSIVAIFKLELPKYVETSRRTVERTDLKCHKLEQVTTTRSICPIPVRE